MDDWKSFAMELWGLSVTTWAPVPERAGKLPEPLEYDTLQDGLVELDPGQRHMVLQCLSCYQVSFLPVDEDARFLCIALLKHLKYSDALQAGRTSASTVISTIRTLKSKSKTFKSIFDDLCSDSESIASDDSSSTFHEDTDGALKFRP